MYFHKYLTVFIFLASFSKFFNSFLTKRDYCVRHSNFLSGCSFRVDSRIYPINNKFTEKIKEYQL